ncbi:MAG: PAC2 family protein [Chloroflexota bacterium]
MKIGAFEVTEPVPTLRDPHAIVMIRPWVDVGNVGTMTLQRLERHFQAEPLAKLARPGTFFDFTRYRPTVKLVDGKREFTYPNTNVNYAQPGSGPGLIFLHVLEPHAMAEDYIESIVELFRFFGVKVYCRIGAMYDSVPHTRPIVITGNPGTIEPRPGMTPAIQQRQSQYEGPTTILNTLAETATEMGIENMSFMAHLPHYAQLEEDYAGTARMIEVLSAYYDVPSNLAPTRRGQRQYQEIEAASERQPEMKALVARLETYYDQQYDNAEAQTTLSPEIERFLRGLGSESE